MANVDGTSHGNEVRSLADEFEHMKKLVNTYYPGLVPTLECVLAVCAALSFEGRTKPLAVILVTTSGYGKSAVVQMLYPVSRSRLDQYVYRSDKFTPKAFVSHVANAGKNSRIDLLPKLKNKVLLTKELSTMFRARDEELKDTFAILIPILDGKGFQSDSGAKGRRGYSDNIVFNWIGATTSLPDRVHRMMYQLGTRLLFYEVPAIMPGDDELLDYARRDDIGQAEVECAEAVNRFLVRYFDEYPVGTIPAAAIEIPEEHLLSITQWAKLLANTRRELKSDKNGKSWVVVGAAQAEGPYKIVNYFKELARAHALVHGRIEVNADDLELVGRVAISSVPEYLWPIIKKLRAAARISSTECERLCRVTRPTARDYLMEASLLELGTLAKGVEAANTPDVLSLAPGLQWLRTLKKNCPIESNGEK